MRCIGSEGVPLALSRLALHRPSHLPINPSAHSDVAVTSPVSDVTIPTGPVRAFPIEGLKPHALADSSTSSLSSSVSPQLSPMSVKSDSDFAQSDSSSPVVRDFPAVMTMMTSSSTTSSSSPRVPSHPVLPGRFPASASSPELNSITVLTDSCAPPTASRRRLLHLPLSPFPSAPSPGFSSMASSLYGVSPSGGDDDSPAESLETFSSTSTAKNSPSRNAGGSLSSRSSSSSGSRTTTIPDEVYPRAISSLADLSVSESQLAVGRTHRVKVPVRKLSEGRTEGIVSDLLKRYHHRSADTVLHNQPSTKTGEGAGQENKKNPPAGAAVQLPERYRHVLKKSGSYGNIGNATSRKSSSSSEQGQDLTSREKDLGTALAWIRNEMAQMKEQDKVLLKRFIELRATILKLRCTYGSASDICSMDGSSASLNYEVRSSGSTNMRNAGSDAMLAGGRMYSTMSSLSLPCSPQLSRLRWGSDDLM